MTKIFVSFLSILFIGSVFGSKALADEMVFPVRQQKERFDGYLSRLRSSMAAAGQLATVDEKISYFEYAGVRSDLMYLQHLIRVYKGERYKELKTFYAPIKDFEDHISHYGDQKYFQGMAAGADAETVARYARSLKDERAKYEEFLLNSGWLAKEDSVIDRLEKTLLAIDWPSLKKDRNHILKSLAKRMDSQQSKVYDMREVEDGIHEFKRDARRLSYTLISFGNLVTPDYAKECPIGKEPVKTEKTSTTEYTCRISGCLFDRLNSAMNEMNNLKYEGLNYQLRGQPVGEDVITRAQKVHDEIKTGFVYAHIASELRSCRSKDIETDAKDGEDVP